MSASSRVWFTLQGGILTEIYFPQLDQVAAHSLTFAVSDGHSLWLEGRDLQSTIEHVHPQALLFRQVSRHPRGFFSLQKTYLTDPKRDVLLVDLRFTAVRSGYDLYVLYRPAPQHTTVVENAMADRGALLAQQGEVASALLGSPPLVTLSNGFQGVNDGQLDLSRHRRLTWLYDRADRGIVVQTGQLPRTSTFTLALGFGRTMERARKKAEASLTRGFSAVQQEYIKGWSSYLGRLRPVSRAYQRQIQLAAMVLKAHEDKTYEGASIASMSIPWGETVASDRPGIGGYHLVWARDLYHVATAFWALGDQETARQALDYLFGTQQQPDGSFPQNTWLDGRPYWSAVQLDEVAYPLILAWQLGRHDATTWQQHVKRAAEYLVRHGPQTPQDRWEEESGLCPSTMAAEIAGLVCASAIARRHGAHEESTRYLKTADRWASRLEPWLVTTTGPLDRVPAATSTSRRSREANRRMSRAGQRASTFSAGYYLRINNNRDPDDGARLELNNGGGSWDERQIVDAGFLELVRLGIRHPRHPAILRSLAVIDRVLRVETPAGPAWYRYNHDGYGETATGAPYEGAGVGRLWPLLTGERGEYVVAAGGDASPYLQAMMRFANPMGMIPEQVWDRAAPTRSGARVGRGTGSATPLAWSMAQFIRLVRCVEEGRIVEQPDIVARRYLGR